ncbi:ubiquitin-associated domain-containing protein [Cavenderia fasciculata]|uniref:Ubiquitin-associated domain-containing protein n=1 Tax=Cavenderia fasciculata TaxID=261658 RepID=F4PWD5_CACFS|nr:ubiquitin-associated domain-containing protein [Cavenderia fasciculata]EGG20299.1 ubiquitin-associated domain-containing protein [Cavenderia fasciculata]|eukprot:XP_004367282.1 ubiquitin-associated domain-containing protein [Cavenderia fasciculata]
MNNDSLIEITVVDENEQIYQVPVDLTGSVEQFQRVLEFETTIIVKDQILLHEGKELESSKIVSQCNIKQGDLIFLRKRRPVNPAQQQVAPGHQQQFQQQQQQQRRPQQQQQQDPFTDPKTLINYFKNNPTALEDLANKNPQFADAILTENEEVLTLFIESVRKQRRMAELAADPLNEEGQRLLYEEIQRENIEQNMHHAIEHTPEVFGRVIMLYIDTTINNIPIKTFVDTGAQQSIMTAKCAERCGLMRLLDKRFHGVAKGVGTAKILGRVHAANIKIGNSNFSIALSILDNPSQDTEFILGLDMLKRHQCLVNLKKDCLEIGEEHVPFLAEKDLKEILGFDEALPENYTPPTNENNNNNNNNNRPSSTSSTSSTSNSSPTNTNTRNPVAAPTIASPPSAQTQATPTFPEESIGMLMSLGASRQKAIQLLTRARGNVDQAASLFFGM